MRIYFAGIFNAHIGQFDAERLVAQYKPKYLLDSFFYKTQCEKTIQCVDINNFMLDSGAFSFMSGAKISKKQMEEYIAQYIEFINRYDVKHFIEIDMDMIFGLKQVEKWRAMLEKETGKQSIPVWHRNRGVKYYRDMVDEYRYIAIGSQVQKIFNISKQDYENIKKMVLYAYSKGVKVHGLGFTKTQEIQDYKYFSVDSSTWKMGAILGRQVHKFNGTRIQSKKVKTNNRADFRKMIENNFIEWCKYQKYMDRGIV